MTHDQLIAAFESTELAAPQFSHAEHVRAGWWYLTHYPVLEALVRFSAALRRFATAKGVPEKYHETVTVGYMLIIAERIDSARSLSWADFAARNPDLLTPSPSLLSRYYTEETLASEHARRAFVMPDRVATRSQPT
jgi:hypothetical protein